MSPKNLSTSEPISILVVIVCYRAVELVLDCLRSLEPEISRIPGVKVSICENGTNDRAAQELAAAIRCEGWQDWVSLKKISPNNGFAGGNNAILRDAMNWPMVPRYFLLLNADTIVRPGALSSMLQIMESRPEVGIVGPRLEHLDGTPQISCFKNISPVSEFLESARTRPITRCLHHYEVPIALFGDHTESDWISFACVMIRSNVLQQVGLLDDGYYLYFDDPDYGRRARQANWNIAYCSSARVVHLVGQSNPVVTLTQARRRRPRYYYAARSRYFAKHFGTAGLWLANIAWMAGRSISWLRELVGNKSPHVCEKQWLDIWTHALRPLQNNRIPLSTNEWVSICQYESIDL